MVLRFPNLAISTLEYPEFPADSYTFQRGEKIAVTEKIPGIQARYVYHEGKTYMGTQYDWGDTGVELLESVYKQYAGLLRYTQSNPGHVVYAVMYEDKMAVFSILDATTGQFIPTTAWRARAKFMALPLVPLLGVYEWDDNVFRNEIEPLLSEKSSLLSDQCRVGLVLTPFNERYDLNFDRVAYQYNKGKNVSASNPS